MGSLILSEPYSAKIPASSGEIRAETRESWVRDRAGDVCCGVSGWRQEAGNISSSAERNAIKVNPEQLIGANNWFCHEISREWEQRRTTIYSFIKIMLLWFCLIEIETLWKVGSDWQLTQNIDNIDKFNDSLFPRFSQASRILNQIVSSIQALREI